MTLFGTEGELDETALENVAGGGFTILKILASIIFLSAPKQPFGGGGFLGGR